MDFYALLKSRGICKGFKEALDDERYDAKLFRKPKGKGQIEKFVTSDTLGKHDLHPIINQITYVCNDSFEELYVYQPKRSKKKKRLYLKDLLVSTELAVSPAVKYLGVGFSTGWWAGPGLENNDLAVKVVKNEQGVTVWRGFRG